MDVGAFALIARFYSKSAPGSSKIVSCSVVAGGQSQTNLPNNYSSKTETDPESKLEEENTNRSPQHWDKLCDCQPSHNTSLDWVEGV